MRQLRDEFETLAELYPEQPGPLLFLGLICNRMNDPQRGLDYLDRGFHKQGAERAIHHELDRNPRSITFLMMLGNYYLEKESYFEAEEVFLKVIKLDPNHIGALILLGRIEIASGRRDQAIDRWEQALSFADKTQSFAEIAQLRRSLIPALLNELDQQIANIPGTGPLPQMISLRDKTAIQIRLLEESYKHNEKLDDPDRPASYRFVDLFIMQGRLQSSSAYIHHFSHARTEDQVIAEFCAARKLLLTAEQENRSIASHSEKDDAARIKNNLEDNLTKYIQVLDDRIRKCQLWDKTCNAAPAESPDNRESPRND